MSESHGTVAPGVLRLNSDATRHGRTGDGQLGAFPAAAGFSPEPIGGSVCTSACQRALGPRASLPEGLEKASSPLQFSRHGVGVSGMQAQIPARGKQVTVTRNDTKSFRIPPRSVGKSPSPSEKQLVFLGLTVGVQRPLDGCGEVEAPWSRVKEGVVELWGSNGTRFFPMCLSDRPASVPRAELEAVRYGEQTAETWFGKRFPSSDYFSKSTRSKTCFLDRFQRIRSSGDGCLTQATEPPSNPGRFTRFDCRRRRCEPILDFGVGLRLSSNWIKLRQ